MTEKACRSAFVINSGAFMPDGDQNSAVQDQSTDLQDNAPGRYQSPSGVTGTQVVRLPGMQTDSGYTFQELEISYMTLGRLSPRRDNAILICHALSGNAHVAGISPNSGRPGWWDFHVGPGRSIDTNRYFVICSNVIGGCNGSTGPTSLNPETGQPWRMHFPPVTIRDMVRAQTRLIDHLGIETLFAAIGGSMGGMQSMVWGVDYPERVRYVVPIASCMAHSAMQIAFNEVGRQAIISDPQWNKGNYSSDAKPDTGLAVARMMGHVTYLSEFSMDKKFGRRIQRPAEPEDIFPDFYRVESYLKHQGHSFVERFDPNSYLYITKALDRFELFAESQTEVETKLARVGAGFLVVSFDSDWLYPPSQSRELTRMLKKAGKQVSYVNLQTPYGHDSFLIYNVEFSRILKGYLNNRYQRLSALETAS
ncbi:MAG: homoserine O-acetyltransferase [Leptospiraceae bacterium]|nr:homoserine O-acetyltransferase [Leptospiraceae bacterium]